MGRSLVRWKSLTLEDAEHPLRVSSRLRCMLVTGDPELCVPFSDESGLPAAITASPSVVDSGVQPWKTGARYPSATWRTSAASAWYLTTTRSPCIGSSNSRWASSSWLSRSSNTLRRNRLSNTRARPVPTAEDSIGTGILMDIPMRDITISPRVLSSIWITMFCPAGIILTRTRTLFSTSITRPISNTSSSSNRTRRWPTGAGTKRIPLSGQGNRARRSPSAAARSATLAHRPLHLLIIITIVWRPTTTRRTTIITRRPWDRRRWGARTSGWRRLRTRANRTQVSETFCHWELLWCTDFEIWDVSRFNGQVWRLLWGTWSVDVEDGKGNGRCCGNLSEGVNRAVVHRRKVDRFFSRVTIFDYSISQSTWSSCVLFVHIVAFFEYCIR